MTYQVQRSQDAGKLHSYTLYFVLNIDLGSPGRTDKAFQMLPSFDAATLARAVRLELIKLIELPGHIHAVTVGQLYPLEHMVNARFAGREPGIDLAGTAEAMVFSLIEDKMKVPQAMGLGDECRDMLKEQGLAVTPQSLAGEVTCLLPVVLVGEAASLNAWISSRLDRQAFWLAHDSRVARKLAGLLKGCQAKALGIISDSRLQSVDSLILASQAVMSRDEFDMGIIPEYALKGVEVQGRPLNMPLLIGGGGLWVPFLTFDAFAETFPQIPADELDRHYIAYIYAYRKFSMDMLLSGVHLRIIRGNRAIFGIDESARDSSMTTLALESVLDESITDTLIERSIQPVPGRNKRPAALTACVVALNHGIQVASDQAADCQTHGDPLFIVMSALDGNGQLLWQENIYPVLPSNGEAVMAYLEKLARQQGVKVAWQQVDWPLYCPQRRKLVGLQSTRLEASEAIDRVMTH